MSKIKTSNPNLQAEELERLEMLQKSRENKGLKLEVDIISGELQQFDEIKSLVAKDFENPQEKYDIYYKGIGRILRKYLPSGKENKAGRELIYDEKNIFLNLGKKKSDNNVIDRGKLTMNDSGTDFTDASVRALYREIDMPKITSRTANELLEQRKNLLGFCTLVSEAEAVSKNVPGSVMLCADTEPKLRTKIIRGFREGEIRAVFNVGILTTGFDYPELETILMARSTMSLGLYYQIYGRGLRVHPSKKDTWLYDLGGNHSFFGDIESLKIRMDYNGNYDIWNKGKQLTNVGFRKC